MTLFKRGIKNKVVATHKMNIAVFIIIYYFDNFVKKKKKKIMKKILKIFKYSLKSLLEVIVYSHFK